MSEIGNHEAEKVESASGHGFEKIKPESEMSINSAKSMIDSFFTKNKSENVTDVLTKKEDYLVRNEKTGEQELKPNVKIEQNGYIYETDKQGRVIKVSAHPLRLKNHEGRKTINENISDMKESDDKGHLIGDLFDGAPHKPNLVPMDKGLNRSEYKKMEMDLKKAIESGKTVNVDISLKYDNKESKRPDKIIVTYTIDNVKVKKVFYN